MRKFFYGLGIVAAVLILAGGVGIFFLARNGAELDRTSQAYTERSVIAIARAWNADELWKRASPALRKIASRQEIEGMFAAAKDALGPMIDYRGSEGQSLISFNNAHRAVSAQYLAHGHFQKGNADLRIALVEVDGHWMIQGFHINSATLMQHLVGTRS